MNDSSAELATSCRPQSDARMLKGELLVCQPIRGSGNARRARRLVTTLSMAVGRRDNAPEESESDCMQ